MIQTIKNDTDIKIDFCPSKDDKEKFIKKYGMEIAVEKILKTIRLVKTPIIYSLEDYHPRLIKRGIAAAIKFSQEAEILEEDVAWIYQKSIISTSLLSYPTISQTLSTYLSADIRYREQLNLKTSTPEMLWNDDEILKLAISFSLKKSNFSQQLIRSWICNYSTCQYGTSFPIPVAMYLMRRESIRLQKAIRVMDPCAGWGDRLAAAMLLGSEHITSYTGMDPWIVSHNLCKKIKTFLGKYGYGENQMFRFIRNIGSEHEWTDVVGEKYDLIFTSPPYADLEQYACNSDHQCQAWRYDNFGEKFFKPLLEHSLAHLSKKGRIIININNYKNKLINDFLKIAFDLDLQVEEIIGMELALRFQPPSKQKNGQIVRHAEPIFVLKRKDV